MERENLVEVASRIGAVIGAAERLGISPEEAAKRVVAAVDLTAHQSARKEDRAYQIVKAFKTAAEALT